MTQNYQDALTMNEPSMGSMGGGGGDIYGAAASLAMFAYNEAMRSSNEKRQAALQKELNQDAAKTNYEYGELAADSAFARALAMNQITYEQNSPAARKKQLEEAGLSVGLMYGGANYGGGAGSATTQAQGAGAGNQQGGRAANSVEIQAQRMQAMSMGLQMAQMKEQIELTTAQKNNVNADTENKKIDTETKTDIKDIIIENAKQSGRAQWLENIRTEYENEAAPITEATPQQLEVFGNKIYGTAAVNNQSFFSKRESTEIAKLAAEERLTTEQAKGYWQELLNGTISANAAMTKAAAEKLATGYSTGEYTNWRTWVDLGIQAINAISKFTK